MGLRKARGGSFERVCCDSCRGKGSASQRSLGQVGSDLLPTNRASRSLVKFVFGEEDEHEE
ncbi:hypothetical protein DF035_19315, partial [Burkholderia contaminans]